VDIRYWDSAAFLGWLKEEEDKVDECRVVLQEAEAGRILLVTSALTLAEVIKLRRSPPIEKQHADLIKRFFENSYIEVRDVNRYLAELARQLVWDHAGLNPKDAIHVATAVHFGMRRLETFDDGLIGLDGQISSPPLRIGRPAIGQRSLDFTEDEDRDG